MRRALDMRAARLRAALPASLPALPAGRIVASSGLLLEADGLTGAVGELVAVATRGGIARAEISGFRDGNLLLTALEPVQPAPGDRLWPIGRMDRIPVGDALLGRVVDGLGQPLDGGPPPVCQRDWPRRGLPLPPLSRADVTETLWTGIRPIDALLTLGRGQRLGLVAGTGVGKTALLRQLVAGTQADAVVLALIGERGREIAAMVDGLSAEARARTHVVSVPADHPAPLRLAGADRAFAVAEAMRAEGRHVLLLLDSLTRLAHARREIGIALGEPAGARGYPASATALIPTLLERAGNDAISGGAITAIVTVLADGDDVVADPVVDAARGVLDGHIILSREIAGRGRFPAIALEQSISRTMSGCVDAAHMAAAARFRADLSALETGRDLISIGAYAAGNDPELDRVLASGPALEAFLRQSQDEWADPADTGARLQQGWALQ